METAKATAEQLAGEAFGYRETIAREKFADYDAVTRNPNVAISPIMAEIIKDSEIGPDLAYHLGKNPAESARIAGMSPNRQAVELGKLEAAIAAPKPAARVPAAPIKPVSGIATGGTKDPGSMSLSEYRAWRKASG